MKHIEILRLLGACDGPGEAIPWAMNYPNAQAAWNASHRGDWMAWLVSRVAQNTPEGSPERRRATLIAVLCAKSVTRLAGEHATEIEGLLARVEAWAQGDDTVDLSTVRNRLRLMRRTSAGPRASNAIDAAAYAAAYVSIGEAAAVRVTVAAEAAVNAAAYAAVDPDANAYDACVDWTRGRDERRRDLADLIRSAIPNVSDLFDHMLVKLDPKADHD